ncbi:MAG: hypothetical protein AAF481_09560 [Acidobacteriota bacterium]
MCDRSECATRSYRAGAGHLTQCLECGTLGFQIGTAYFTARPQELHTIASFFFDIQRAQKSKTSREKVMLLQIESARVMLALSLEELADLVALLKEGWRWVNAPCPPVSVGIFSEAIH